MRAAALADQFLVARTIPRYQPNVCGTRINEKSILKGYLCPPSVTQVDSPHAHSSDGCKRGPSPETTEHLLAQDLGDRATATGAGSSSSSTFGALETAEAQGDGEEKGGCVNTYTSDTHLRKQLLVGILPAFGDICVANDSRLQTQ